MLETKKLYGIDVDVLSDTSTIIVRPGLIKTSSLGNLRQYNGEVFSYSNIVNISDTTNAYKNALLYITDTSTAVSSTDATTQAGLIIPPAPASAFSVAVFTFFSPDGTNAQVVNWNRVTT